MLGDHARALDVVQETKLVLWRNENDFRDSDPFMPWAMNIARFQVLAHLRDRGREKSLFDTELVVALSEETERQVDQLESMRIAFTSLCEWFTVVEPRNDSLALRSFRTHQ